MATITEDYKEKLKEALNSDNTDHEVVRWIEQNFPELKESEDERIRKEIIKLVKFYYGSSLALKHTVSKDKMVAWLEKQGEQKPVPKFKVGDTMRTLQEATDGYTDGMPVVASIDEEYYHCNNELIAIKDQDDYEYPPMNRRQKPTDKVEPKFKVGDTVTVKPMSCHGKVFKGEPFKIVDIIEDNYVSDDGKAYSISLQDGWELVEQNPAWSEEDKRNIERCITKIEIDKQNWEKNGNANTKTMVDADNELISWLKSIKDRYTWKPTEELPHWKKSTLPNDNVTGFNSDFFSYNGYNINYKELFDKLPKDD